MADDVVAELVNDRPRSQAQWEALFAGSWPPYIDADRTAAEALPAVHEAFAHLQVALTRPGDAEREDQLVGAAWGVPIVWGGDPAALPRGYTDALVRSLADRDARSGCDTLVVCAAQVHPERARSGAASQLLGHLVTVALDAGLQRVVAPLRLTAKHEHPTVAVEEYVRWRRHDGEAHDPWLRTHERMGARVVATTPASQHFEATVAQWRVWTGLALETSGEHVVPGALAPLRVDLDSGTAELLEPGAWVRHR